MGVDEKKPSGAEFRKRRREAKHRIEEERVAGMDDGSDEFAALGPPPIDDPDMALAWVRRYQLTAMYVSATRPLTDSLRERLKLVREFGATIGMTQNRVGLEEIAERLESNLSAAVQNTNAAAQPVPPTARPSTARGAPRGPKAIQ